MMNEALLPAIERYDGESFIMIRALRQLGVTLPEIIILSGKYGWITADAPIAWYDQALDVERVDAFYPALVKQWERIVVPRLQVATNVHVHMPEAYLYALQRMEFAIHWKHRFEHYSESWQGRHMADLGRWLNYGV